MIFERLRRNRFVVVGRAGMDLYADPPGSRIPGATHFFACLGGSSANIAACLARQGSSVRLVTAVSDDAVGEFVRHELARYGVEVDDVTTVAGEARTSLAVVETLNDRPATVIYRNLAADLQISPQTPPRLDRNATGALVATGTALATDPSRTACFAAFHAARSKAIPVVLDLDYRPYSWHSIDDASQICREAAEMADVIVGNDDEFAVLAGSPDTALDTARTLAHSRERVVIFKMGTRGSVTLTAHEEFEAGIFDVEALKPTGAGDAFLGALLAALGSGHDLEHAVRRGSACAAIVVTRVGCAPAMPSSGELDAFLARHGAGFPLSKGP